MFELNLLSMSDRIWLHSLEVTINRYATNENRSELIDKLYNFLKGAIQRELEIDEINEIQTLILELQTA